jgi:catechol 2,3-dioxygenase-like lactoylglutathione lyase family enzyme
MTMDRPVPIQGVLETSVYADDLDAADRFYQRVLGLHRHARVDDRHLFFRCGDDMFLVFRTDRTSEPDSTVPPHGATGPSHVAFSVHESSIDAWRHRLLGMGVEIEAEVEWPRGGHSLYFRDPAGNSLELASPRIWGIT